MMTRPASGAEAACLDALERALGGETPPDLGPCPATVLDGALRELVRRRGADAAPLLRTLADQGSSKALRKVAKLAIYRLAWAELHDVPVEKVRAAFYYVRSGSVVEPDDLPGREELEGILSPG